ncbi:MAG: ribosomal protection-like ABC-F family protein [Coprococcus sp.]
MLYQIIDGTLAAGGEIVLEHFDFEIKGRDRIAVVGPNGAGKTTLLRLIAGELSLERDDRRQMVGVRLARNVTVGMLGQQAFTETERTVEEELMAICPARDTWDRERFEFEQKYDRIFTGFGFSKADKGKKLSEFSGGEQTKIALIRLLLMQPDILLLDEPTNHLDVETVEWLERYLCSYPKAVVMVSHDRFFLDRTAEIVYELTGRRLLRYVGNYTEYRRQKYKKLEIQKKQYEQQQAEIARLEELIERFKHKPKKAAFARSKKKVLERMEKLPKPQALEEHLFTGDLLPAVPGSKWVMETEKLQIGYDRPLLEMSLRVRKGQKIGIIGPNGAGKSTFLKTAAGLIPPVKGRCQTGINIQMGYFDQQTAALDSEEQVLEHFHRLFPAMMEKEARQYLAAYLFGGADVCKTVSQLSGGEKSRLVLAEILALRPNFLVLDEPTNHMDIPAKETLESAFRAYKGTILFVSHDRYFIEQVADALLIFENGEASYYPFGYRHYLERKERIAAFGKNTSVSGDATDNGAGDDVAAVIRAEDQALIAGLQNVPKGASLLGHELSTEQAFLDWQLRLAAEAMEQKAHQVEMLTEKREERQMEIYRSSDWMLTLNEDFSKDAELEEAMTAWQQACLDWYDIWQELHASWDIQEISEI